ncbi:serine hydrolase [Pediococcus claussenii]|nr:serine hydrolase [Pediococcus claussenii]ANZ72351.1 serine hydrolase [Pediococcus claussenii]
MLFEQTEALINEAYDAKTTTNMGYTWIKHGKVQSTRWRGIKSSTQFYDLASLTKVIGTVPAVLVVLSKHRLSLDSKVCSILPEVVDDRITIRHLITHTSGVTAWIDNRDALNASELRQAIYRELSFGEDFNQKVVYNDYNYLLLGFIVEKLQHVPVQTVIENEVLRPLGLHNATFSPSALQSVPTEDRNGITIRGMVHDTKAFSLGQHAASAGLFAPMNDVVKFANWMLSDGGKLLNDSQMKGFSRNQTDNPALERSLGWWISNNAERIVLRHSGFTGTFILLDQQTKNGLVFLSSRVYPHPNKQFLDFRQKIYESFENEDR